MIWNNWEHLHGDLQRCRWFAHVGEELDATNVRIRTVTSWELAHNWASAEISWWCVNEASNVLRLQLSQNHRVEYRKWNEHIKTFSTERDELIDSVVAPLVPAQFRQKVVEWIRSHLTSAYLECAYSSLADVHLVRDQMAWYINGRFPCGWNVANEESFPNEAATIVF